VAHPAGFGTSPAHLAPLTIGFAHAARLTLGKGDGPAISESTRNRASSHHAVKAGEAVTRPGRHTKAQRPC
jgi:hypothetical protein